MSATFAELEWVVGREKVIRDAIVEFVVGACYQVGVPTPDYKYHVGYRYYELPTVDGQCNCILKVDNEGHGYPVRYAVASNGCDDRANPFHGVISGLAGLYSKEIVVYMAALEYVDKYWERWESGDW